MDATIEILHLEDDPVDAELVKEKLADGGLGCRILLVRTREHFETALHDGGADIILADYRLPKYDGMSALRTAREMCPDMPFIFVSGTMGEQAVIEALTRGATDYVLKQNLSRLAPAVLRALQEAENMRERRKAERSLAESEAKLRSILENIGVGISLINPEMKILELNKRMREWFPDIDPDRHPICYQAFNVPPRQQVCSYCPTCKTLQDGRVHEATTRTPRDGEVFNYRIISSPLRNAAGELVAAIEMVDDITESSRSREALQRSNDLLHTIIEAAPVAIIGLDLEGRVHSVWNPAAEKMLGWSAREVMGKPLPTVPEDRQEEFKRFREQIRRGMTLDGVEVRRQRRDGTPIDYCIYASPLHDSQGGIRGNIALLVDITERKKLEAQLLQVQKIEAIGQLAGGIAHDFNNILSAITGYAELSVSILEPESQASEYLNLVLEASGRAKELINQILMFSRESVQDLRPIRVDFPVKEALKLIRASVPATIEIISRILSAASALADPTQIHQIVMNLCTNAAQAMQEKGGLLEVHLTDIIVEPADILQNYPDAKPGEYIRLSVSDRGHGIDARHLHRIFDPFFTTKKRGEGTGMGLSVVHGIVTSYGGFVYASNRTGGGSTFEILIPAQARAVAHDAVPETPIPTGNETILFVDDEDMLVDIVKRMLESLGYRVVARTSAVEALEAFKSNPDGFDLLITDMTMPKMSGLDLTERIHQLRPGFPVILCSGFGVEMNARNIAAYGLREIIHKPVLRRHMAMAVRKALDNRLKSQGLERRIPD